MVDATKDPTEWYRHYKGDDPVYEAYLERARTGKLHGYEIQRLGGKRHPATGEKMHPGHTRGPEWESLKNEARKRKFWGTLREMYNVEAAVPLELPMLPGVTPPGIPSAGPTTPGFGVPPLIQQWLRMMGKDLPAQPGRPTPRLGTVEVGAIPPALEELLPPLPPGPPPVSEGWPRKEFIPGPIAQSLEMMRKTLPRAPFRPTTVPLSQWREPWQEREPSEAIAPYLRYGPMARPKVPMRGTPPPSGWPEFPAPTPYTKAQLAHMLLTPGERRRTPEAEELARRQREVARQIPGQFVDVVRRKHQWAVERIPGVSFVERKVAEGFQGLITFFRQFPYAVERGLGWAEQMTPAADQERVERQLELTERIFGGLPGMDVWPTIKDSIRQGQEEKRELQGWLQTLPTGDYYRLVDETSRIYYSGYEPQLDSAQEILGAMQEARGAGREITDEQVTEILRKHEDEGREMLGQFILDPLLIDMFIGAPIGKAMWGLAKLPFRAGGKALRVSGATLAFGERVVSGSRFARYMKANHPVLSEVMENTVKFAPRKFAAGVNWLKTQTAQSLARGVGLRTKDVVIAVGAPPADDIPRTIDMTRKLVAEAPAAEVLARLSTAIQTGKTGSPVHDDILRGIIKAVGGQDEFARVIKAARRGQKISELSGAQVAELIGQQTQRAILKQMGIKLEPSSAGRFANWARRLWVEMILFSRPGWALVNETTNVLYGTLEGYDMFGNLDDMARLARMRRAGILPAELAETGLIAEETLKPLGLESALALEELPLIGKPLSKWPRIIAGLWESGEQGARIRIWAQASDARYADEIAKVRELVSIFPEGLQPEIAGRLMNIYDNSASPQQFAAGVDDLLRGLTPTEGIATLGVDVLHYPDPLTGGYPYPSLKQQVGDELAKAYEEGRLTHEVADNIFAGGYYGLEEEATESLAAIYQRAPMDTRALQEVALEKETWLPFWDDLSPDEQAEILRKAHENAVVRSTNVMEFDSMSNSLGYVASSDKMKDDIFSIRMQVGRDGQHLYSDTRIKANELLRTVQRGLMSSEAYNAAADDLWLNFNTQHRKIYGDAIEEFNNIARRIGKAPKLLRDEVDLLGKLIGQGQDTTSRIGAAFSRKFPGSTGRVIKSHPFHWVIQIEEGPGTRGMWIYVPKGRTPPGVDLADVMRALELDATADDIVAGIPGHRWNEAIDAINTQYRLGKEELAKWQAYVRNQIDQLPIEVRDAAQQIRLVEYWRNMASAKLADAVVKADNFGVFEAHRILFNYLVDSNADALARTFIPFWKWPSRNVPVMAGIMLKNPWILTMFGRYMDVSEQYRQRYNATERMRGYLPLPGTNGQVWFNPVALPMQSFNQMFRPWRSYEEQEPLGTQILHTINRIGFSPAPWITGARVGRGFVPGVMHLAAWGLEKAGVEGAMGAAPRPGDVWQIVPQIQLFAPLMDMALGTDITPTPPWHPYLVRRRIAEWAASERMSPTTGKPITEKEALAASNDPTSELWQTADKDVKWESWKQGAIGYFATYPKFFSPGEQRIRADLRTYQDIPEWRDDLRRIFLEEHWWLKTYWNAFGPEDEQIERYAKSWQEDGRVYPASNRPIKDADIATALQDSEDSLRLAVVEQITRDIRDRDERLAELQEQLSADLAAITPVKTRAYEAAIQQYFVDREAVYAEYPLLEEEIAPKMHRPLNVLMKINANLSVGLFDDGGNPLVEDAPKQYAERANLFRQQLQVISGMLEPVLGYSLLGEFDIRKARYEDPTQAAYNAFERLYLRPAANIIYDEEASGEERDEAKQAVVEGQRDKAALATEIARVHPDWSPEMVARALETPLPDFDTWSRRNDSLKDALWSVVWAAYMDMSALDRRKFRDFVRKHPQAGPQVAAVFEEAMLPKEIKVGERLWERNRAWISIPILTVLADKLGVLGPLEEEGFRIEAVALEAGLRGFEQPYKPGEPYEEVPREQATAYDQYRAVMEQYQALRATSPDEAKAFAAQPQVQQLFDRFAPKGPANDFWNTYYQKLPPGSVSEEIRNHPVVQSVLNPEVRAGLKPEMYAKANRLILDWLKQNPAVANMGTPQEYQLARDVAKYCSLFPEGSRERKDCWRWYRAHPEFGPIIEKFYGARKSGGRAPGKASRAPSGYGNWEEFKVIAGPEIAEDLIASWRGGEPLPQYAERYLRSLHKRHGGGRVFKAWLVELRKLWGRGKGQAISPTIGGAK